MATTGGIKARVTLFTARKNNEVLEGDMCVLKLELLDGVTGAAIADGDVSAIALTLFDKTTGKIINGRSATAVSSPLATKYIGLNEQDNAIIPLTAGGFTGIAAGKLQKHVAKFAITFASALASVNTYNCEFEFAVRRLTVAA